MDYREYVRKFKARPTSAIIDRYELNTAEFRKYARDELRRRHKIRELNKHLRIQGKKPIRPKHSISRNAFGIRPINIGKMF